jgi:hypothetical protein
MKTMGKAVRFVVLVLTPVVALAVPAHAGDTCFDVGGDLLVAENFSKPGKGNCRTVLGYYDDTPTVFVTGTACTTSSGDFLRLVWTEYGGSSGAAFRRANLLLPSMTVGGGHGLLVNTTATQEFAFSMSVVECVPKNNPIP